MIFAAQNRESHDSQILESHDSNRTILNRPILDSESPIQCQSGIAIQGESNMHRIVVTVLCRLRPPFPEGEFALSTTGNPPVSLGRPTISTESPARIAS